jgi:hypothetical protein
MGYRNTVREKARRRDRARREEAFDRYFPQARVVRREMREAERRGNRYRAGSITVERWMGEQDPKGGIHYRRVRVLH